MPQSAVLNAVNYRAFVILIVHMPTREVAVTGFAFRTTAKAWSICFQVKLNNHRILH